MAKIASDEGTQGKVLEHDPNFKGPIANRSCTDVLCCLVFLVFLIGWGLVSVMAFWWGDPSRLIHPSDSQGRICGVDKPGAYNLSDKPFLYFFDLRKCISYSTAFEGCVTPQVCVSSCPAHYFTYLQLEPRILSPLGQDFLTEFAKNSTVCLTEQTKLGIKSFAELERAIDNDECSAYVVPTSPVVGRCLPQIIVDAGNALTASGNATLDDLVDSFGSGGGRVPNNTQLAASESFLNLLMETKAVSEKIASDLSKSWWQILTMLAIAAVISFFWTVLMRFFGGLMVWLSIAAVILILLGGSGFCWYKYKVLKDEGAVDDYKISNFKMYFEMPATFLYSGIVLTVILVIVLIVLLLIRSRITLSIALITESSKAVAAMMSTLFFPVVPFVLHVGCFIIWTAVAIWLASWGQPNCRRLDVPDDIVVGNKTLGNGTKCACDDIGKQQDQYCVFVNYTSDGNYIMAFQAYNLFGFFWLTCFVSAFCDLALSGAFASWYWAFRKPDDVPAMPLMNSIGRAMRYHLGSLAFGSLLLAIVKFIRAVLDYVDNKLKGADNKVAKFIMMCLKCWLWCLEKFLKFLTRNAYIMIAIYGASFCEGARDSFLLLARNIVRVVVLDKVTDFLLFLGKFGVTVGMGVLSFYYFSGRWVIDEVVSIELHYYFVPVVIVTVASYLICDAFFDVYEMAVDTTFLCFLEDGERNDGTAEKPYFMSKRLMKILGKENEFHNMERSNYAHSQGQEQED